MSFSTQGIYDIHELERKKNNEYLRMLAMQQQGMAGMIGSGNMGIQNAFLQDSLAQTPEVKPEKNPKLLLLL